MQISAPGSAGRVRAADPQQVAWNPDLGSEDSAGSDSEEWESLDYLAVCDRWLSLDPAPRVGAVPQPPQLGRELHPDPAHRAAVTGEGVMGESPETIVSEGDRFLEATAPYQLALQTRAGTEARRSCCVATD